MSVNAKVEWRVILVPTASHCNSGAKNKSFVINNVDTRPLADLERVAEDHHLSEVSVRIISRFRHCFGVSQPYDQQANTPRRGASGDAPYFYPPRARRSGRDRHAGQGSDARNEASGSRLQDHEARVVLIENIEAVARFGNIKFDATFDQATLLDMKHQLGVRTRLLPMSEPGMPAIRL